MPSKVNITEIESILPNRIDLFVASSSFESRCFTIAEKITSLVKTAVVLRNKENHSSSDRHAEYLESLFKGSCSQVSVSLSSPTDTADSLIANVIQKMKALDGGDVFIDITTFTHEQLLILTALLNISGLSCNIWIGYTGASEYSTNTDTQNLWLSRGIKNVRSVLGFPGRLLPTRKLHLMILVGFESERAKALIELMEPDKISLGVGRAEQSYSLDHYDRNKIFLKKVEDFLARQSLIQIGIDQFEFSCMNPIQTMQDVLGQVNKFESYNTVVCPMNTKFSTMGAGMAAIENDRIQLVYSEAEEYNEIGYSSPGDTATIFKYK